MVSSSVSAHPSTVHPSGPDRAPEVGPQGPPLERYANSSPPPPKGGTASRSRRYRRRSVLWTLSSLQRVRQCGRVRCSPDGLVGLRRASSALVTGGRSGLSGLKTCGSVWACPVCNAKVMAKRAQELGDAVAAHHASGGSTIFGTSTLRHHKGQRLDALWQALSKAWASCTKGKAWDGRVDRLGIQGFVRAAEVNISWENGWHVHLHWILFTAGDVTPDQVDDFGGWFAARWARAVVRQGLASPLGVGQDARLVRSIEDGDLAKYVTKMDGPSKLGLELTHSQSKRARSAHTTVPAWELLSLIEETGDLDVLDLWQEYESASHGRRQLTWSYGLRRRLLGQEVERTDEDLAAEDVGDETLVYFAADGWAYLVDHAPLIPKLLDAADHSRDLVLELLASHGISYLLPQEVHREEVPAQEPVAAAGAVRRGLSRRDVRRARAHAARLSEERPAAQKRHDTGHVVR